MEEWQKQGFASEEAMQEWWRQDHREQEMEQTRLMVGDGKYYLAECNKAKKDLREVQRILEEVSYALECEDVRYAFMRSDYLVDCALYARESLKRAKLLEDEIEEEAKDQLEGVAQ